MLLRPFAFASYSAKLDAWINFSAVSIEGSGIPAIPMLTVTCLEISENL